MTRLAAYRMLVLGLAILAGSAALARQSESEPSFDRDIQPIFDLRCATCHNNDDPVGGLTLEMHFAYDQIVGVPSLQSGFKRVEPGNSQQSYLLHKIVGTHISAGGTGFAMPAFTGNLIRPEEIRLIEAWIDTGAKK